MTEVEHISLLKKYWPADLTPSSSLVLLFADEAVRAFPRSAPLWFMRGQLIWLADDDSAFPVTEAALSFEKAIEIAPTSPDPYDFLAGYHDGIRDDPEKAMEYYRKAAELRGETVN